MLKDGDLLSKTVHAEFRDEGYVLIYELLYCENIAETIEFSIE